MFCTVCEITTINLSHYKSELHIINLKRKLSGYSPLTIEEFDSDSKTEDLSLNLDLQNSETTEKFYKDVNTSNIKTERKCMFCDENDFHTHYRMHGFSDEQICYLRNMQCYICYEKFFESELLMKHIDTNSHRTAVTDGTSLYLENGKVLNPNKIHLPVRIVARQVSNIKTPHYTDKMVEKIKDSKESEKLTISLTNNRTWGKFIH